MKNESNPLKQRIEDLAGLMEEFRLAEAEYQEGDVRVRFARRTKPAAVTVTSGVPTSEPTDADLDAFALEPAAPAPVAPKGTPITSPMNGIYYNASSPGAPPFVKVGDTITAGQTIGLVEAMKVFNEIPAPTSGTVVEIVAQAGAIVSPGDVLLYVN
ncbi:MAG: acetyl-CoA carboxylase biotin carboxyl carrier protein subunit [Fimbriimonadaceae bacterium]|nr:acetyl-CoA carboxylase biotin carboxyl carrier protein subunit [Fimbriimonadaceae bacterium]